MSAEIHVAVDGYGLPIHFIVTESKVQGCTVAHNLLKNFKLQTLSLQIKDYYSPANHEIIDKKVSKSVILRKRSSFIGNTEMNWATL